MKKIEFFCDICGKEFPPQEFSFLNGTIIKVDMELKPKLAPFEGHYCGEDTKKILEFIDKLKNEQSRTADSGTEQHSESHAGDK